MLQTDCCDILGCLEKLFATRGEEEKQKEPNKLKMMTMKQSIKIHLSFLLFFLPLVRGCLLLGTLTLFLSNLRSDGKKYAMNSTKEIDDHQLPLLLELTSSDDDLPLQPAGIKLFFIQKNWQSLLLHS